MNVACRAPTIAGVRRDEGHVIVGCSKVRRLGAAYSRERYRHARKLLCTSVFWIPLSGTAGAEIKVPSVVENLQLRNVLI